jgi:sugar phosphate isomerase/epimerase
MNTESPNSLRSRRKFLKDLSIATGGLCLSPAILSASPALGKTNMKLGLVTYLWGRDWDVPTLIKNCSKAGLLGVELRVDHAHGVGLGISESKIAEVKKQFDDSPVEFVGMGTNEEYDSPDPKILAENIERTKEYIRISHAIGGSGVKVKPNKLHEGVPKEKTLEQIGRALDGLGEYAADFNQMIRLEVHGSKTDELPNIKTIMDHAPHKNVGVCWNCNDTDLKGGGLEYNFNLVKDRFADIVHVRELNIGEYPYQELMTMFNDMKYEGWILLEARTNPDDRVKAMIEQREVFEKMTKS